MQRLLIALGILLLVAGLLWPWLSRLGLGSLPGDIRIERGSTTIYVPLATGLLLSVLVSALLWFLRR